MVSSPELPTEVDVAIIGSGIGGLCCAALLARYGFDVAVFESHTIPGGAAHAFARDGFIFDSGPSLHSGLSYSPSPHPLRQVLDAIGEDLPCATYDTWGCWFPEGRYDIAVGAEPFCEVLRQISGDRAVAEWRDLQTRMAPLKDAAIAVPPLAVRFDWGALSTAGRYAPNLARHVTRIATLTGPFSRAIAHIQDPFIRNWLDLLCFLLSGLPADGTSTAEMAFMFAEWYRPNVTLDYPIGGTAAIVDALVRGLTKFGGQLHLGTHVDRVLVENTRATGIQLRNGRVVRARCAVVSNASVWDTLKLLPDGVWPERDRAKRQSTPACHSFMHLHLGIDSTDLPADLACHYAVVNDWNLGVAAPQNVVLISIPSVLDPSLAPAGKHVIHAYTPGNEPYDIWQHLDRRSPEYAALKRERAEVMWQALERFIPDIRDRAELTLVGTPLTHARFLRRDRGSYGPAIRAGEALFPGPKTPLQNLLCCGDSTFPGIGLPAVAASGAIAANTLVPLRQHRDLLNALGL